MMDWTNQRIFSIAGRTMHSFYKWKIICISTNCYRATSFHIRQYTCISASIHISPRCLLCSFVFYFHSTIRVIHTLKAFEMNITHPYRCMWLDLMHKYSIAGAAMWITRVANLFPGRIEYCKVHNWWCPVRCSFIMNWFNAGCENMLSRCVQSFL